MAGFTRTISKGSGRVAFSDDLPPAAEQTTVEILAGLLSATDANTVIWCRNENHRLRKLIEETFQVSLRYASYEMNISRTEFQTWKAPTLPVSCALRGFDMQQHDAYLNLLESGMRHVVKAGTTPFRDNSAQLKLQFARLHEEKRFHALWCEDKLAGICYSDGGEIDTLVVNETHQRSGFGTYLLYVALDNLLQAQEENACLYVVDHNTSALAFYQHCGMRVTGHSAQYLISKKKYPLV